MLQSAHSRIRLKYLHLKCPNSSHSCRKCISIRSITCFIGKITASPYRSLLQNMSIPHSKPECSPKRRRFSDLKLPCLGWDYKLIATIRSTESVWEVLVMEEVHSDTVQNKNLKGSKISPPHTLFFLCLSTLLRNRGKKELKKAWKKITFSLQNTGKTVTYFNY